MLVQRKARNIKNEDRIRDGAVTLVVTDVVLETNCAPWMYIIEVLREYTYTLINDVPPETFSLMLYEDDYVTVEVSPENDYNTTEIPHKPEGDL